MPRCQARATAPRGGSDLVFPELPPSEDRVHCYGIEPGQNAELARLLAQSEGIPDDTTCFGRVAPAFDGFLQMGLQFFVNFAVHTITAQGIRNSRPYRHIRPSLA